MQIVCPNCKTSYQLADYGDRGERAFRALRALPQLVARHAAGDPGTGRG